LAGLALLAAIGVNMREIGSLQRRRKRGGRSSLAFRAMLVLAVATSVDLLRWE
jgi:hypothetical protein